MFHVLTLKHAFFYISKALLNGQVLQEVVKGYRMDKPSNEYFPTPNSYHKMMLECWQKLPKQRPTFAKLHEFFRDYFIDTEPDYSEMDDL